MQYGYARASADRQSVGIQARELARAGCEKVFREAASEAKTDRRQLRRALAHLGAGDVLVVTRLDHLARSTRELLNTLAAIAENGAGVRSLGDAWADTTTAYGRRILTILEGLAAVERALFRARTAEGQAHAKARGGRLGRPPKLTRRQQREAIRRRDHGGTAPDIARSYNVNASTMSRLTA